MASVTGGLFQLAPPGSHVQQSPTSSDPGNLNLASITDTQTTVGGGGDTVAGGGQTSASGFDTVGGSSQGSASGFDTVSGPSQSGSSSFAGQPQGGGTEQVVATQTQSGGNTVLQLSDGSTITVAGSSHVDSSFFH